MCIENSSLLPQLQPHLWGGGYYFGVVGIPTAKQPRKAEEINPLSDNEVGMDIHAGFQK